MARMPKKQKFREVCKMIINHNLNAMNAHRQLGIGNANGAKSMEKLSSGFRINRAGDDAAGLSISEKMRAQIRGLNQASRNAQDGISLIQTAEGALNETQAILQRMRELAVQSSNDTNVNELDREAIDNEFKQLKKEIDRIGNDTEFNTQKLLKGGEASTGQVTVETTQAGVAPGGVTPATSATQTFTFDGAEKGTVIQIGDTKYVLYDSDDGGYTGGDVGIDINSLTTDEAIIDAIVGHSTQPEGVTLSKGSATTLVVTTTATGADANGTIETKVISGSGVVAGGDSVAGAANEGIDATGTKGTAKITITTNFAAGDKIEINGKTYTAVEATATPGDGEFAVGADSAGTAANLLVAIMDADTTVDVSSSATDNVITLVQAIPTTVADPFEAEMKADFSATFQIGANQTQTMQISIGDMRAEALGIDNVSLATGTDAREAITTINDAINKVSTQRSYLGAYQNRLEHTIKNLDNSAENLQAAESRIRDIDMAKEMMEFTKNNILQQAAQAMLAQANQQPQGVLQLLR